MMNGPPALTNTELIETFLAAFRKANPAIEAAVLLVGSVARNTATAESDLDLLIVAEQKVSLQRTANRLHVQVMTEAQFLDRLKEGDDFAAWCVRFGIPIVQAPVWNRITGAATSHTWPKWQHKIEHAARRLLLANGLLELGDDEAAIEEVTYAVSHVARAILLKENVFPLSRPEMISQLKDSQYRQLGAILADLTFGTTTNLQLRRTISYVKKLLVHLDGDGFAAYVRSRSQARAAKASRRQGIMQVGG